MLAGRVPGHSTSLSQGRWETSLFPTLPYESGIKAEFGYDGRRGFSPCDRGASWCPETVCPDGKVLFPAPPMKEGLKPSLATTIAEASRRVIAARPGMDTKGASEQVSWVSRGPHLGSAEVEK